LALEAGAPTPARARALDSAAGLALIQGDYETAGAGAEQAARLSHQAGDRAGLAQALTTQGLAAIFADDVERATSVLEEARRAAQEVGDQFAEGSALVYLTTAFLARREYDRSRQLGDEAEVLLERLGDPEGLAWTRVLRGAAAWRQGDHEEAVRSVRPGILGFSELGHVVGLSVGIYVCGQLAAPATWTDAVILLAAAEALRESVGAALLPFARAWLDDTMGRAAAALGTDVADQLWRTGASCTAPEAVDRALLSLAGDGPRSGG
jgi:hypothetical protein